MQGFFEARIPLKKGLKSPMIALVIITHFGDHSFRIESGSTAILFNPPNNRLKADLVVWSEAKDDDLKLAGREINFAGDYEAQGIEIRGWASPEERKKNDPMVTSYMVSWEDIHLAFPGPIHEKPSEAALDAWEDVGVLFLPVGEKMGLSVEEAVKLIKSLNEPGYVIAYGPQVQEFSKKIGQSIEKMEKLVFKKKDIPTKTTFITFV